MLDTNILIYLIKMKPPSVARRVNALVDADRLCMSFVSYAELLKGAERSRRKTEVLRQLDGLIRQIPVQYTASPALCRHYAEQFTRLNSAGTLIGANDLWIACHALAEDAVLVTNNIREFERVAGLRLENWGEGCARRRDFRGAIAVGRHKRSASRRIFRGIGVIMGRHGYQGKKGGVFIDFDKDPTLLLASTQRTTGPNVLVGE